MPWRPRLTQASPCIFLHFCIFIYRDEHGAFCSNARARRCFLWLAKEHGPWRQKWIRMGEYVVPTACHGAGAGGRVVVGIFTSKRATQTTQPKSHHGLWTFILSSHQSRPKESSFRFSHLSQLMALRPASPCLPLSSSARMNDRVAMRTMMVLRCRSRKCKWPFPFVRLFLRGGRSRSLTFPKLSLRDNRSVKDGFLRIVPSLPPPPPPPPPPQSLSPSTPLTRLPKSGRRLVPRSTSASAEKFVFCNAPFSSFHFHRSFSCKAESERGGGTRSETFRRRCQRRLLSFPPPASRLCEPTTTAPAKLCPFKRR